MTAETPSNASLPVPYVVPSEILTAIGRYYAHRRASRMDNAIDSAAPLRWDKDADLAALNEVCERLQIPYEASCGTFQFTAPDGSMHRIDENSYPHSKPVNASIIGQVLAARLRRQGYPSYISACIPNPYELMAHLLELDWLELTPARKEYIMSDEPRSYTYGTPPHARTYSAQSFTEPVRNLMRQLNKTFLTTYNVCFLNRYDDQKNQLGWHADDSPEMDRDHSIAVVSLGAEREIWWKPNEETGIVPPSQRQRLGHGSLFIMPPRFQDTHLHRIPKADREVGVRISLTFRHYL